MSELIRKLIIYPAYDRGKKGGIHGVDMRWNVVGEKGGVSFAVYTNWFLPHVQERFDRKPLNNCPYMFHKPMPADISHHSFKRRNKWETRIKNCDVLGGKTCYCDGSTLNAQKYFDILVAEGGEALWLALENYYQEVFDESIS